ncbi:hypothetical protein, partial [Enterobacter cloacae complex sp. 4DZ1-17B1]|uniref:hypothetical protein n=1 Tax=Enterobacter cloacae complex sp. 4DZ1-17B1 TaxID=2511991 RepID=UPI001CA5632E
MKSSLERVVRFYRVFEHCENGISNNHSSTVGVTSSTSEGTKYRLAKNYHDNYPKLEKAVVVTPFEKERKNDEFRNSLAKKNLRNTS